MYVTQHNAKDFRNLENASFSPDRSINIIFGENGQGKTNLIESIWLFTGCHSFRTRKNSQLIREGCESSLLDISFFAFDREQSARLELTDKKNVWINGVHKDTPRRLIGEFPAVLFSPATLSIVQDGPGERRKFIDIAISLVKPNYAGILSRYIKTLSNETRFCARRLREECQFRYVFPVGRAAIFSRRKAAALQIRIYRHDKKAGGGKLFQDNRQARKKVNRRYDTFCKTSNFDEREAAKLMLDELEKNRENDIRRQFTGTGPHKDDLSFFINKRNARIYGSQGQQRSCALSLKLAEADILEKITEESPIILLDDVMSELDDGRQELLLERLGKRQVFITCCDPSQLLRLQKGKAFEMIDGSINEI